MANGTRIAEIFIVLAGGNGIEGYDVGLAPDLAACSVSRITAIYWKSSSWSRHSLLNHGREGIDIYCDFERGIARLGRMPL
jgi:hypothetical protein